jgi:hypothetical protein
MSKSNDRKNGRVVLFSAMMLVAGCGRAAAGSSAEPAGTGTAGAEQGAAAPASVHFSENAPASLRSWRAMSAWQIDSDTAHVVRVLPVAASCEAAEAFAGDYWIDIHLPRDVAGGQTVEAWSRFELHRADGSSLTLDGGSVVVERIGSGPGAETALRIDAVELRDLDGDPEGAAFQVDGAVVATICGMQ